MRYAIIENGIVTNVVLADFVLAENWVEDAESVAQIGGVYDGAFHVAPDIVPTIQEYEIAVQKHLDEYAQSKGYDSILSACSYAAEANQFQVESKQFITWRSEVWAYCYQVLQNVQGNQRSAPSIKDLIAELPVFGG
jgi:hypothetical protein